MNKNDYFNFRALATSGGMPDYRRVEIREVDQWRIMMTLSIEVNKNDPFNFLVTHDE